MKAVGLIVEYNPFHNGHAFHLHASKEAADADIVIAVISGNFLQRGEPALVSKWARTKMALAGGADLVLELPYIFAAQKAETFANGAVSILAAAGCDALCFGSEDGDINAFLNTLDFLNENQAQYNHKVKDYMKSGVSYPKALSLSFEEFEGTDSLISLAKPNNILGYQYIKAIQDQKSSIKPLTVRRKNADYHDEHFASETIASATSIRKAIFGEDENADKISQYVPQATFDQLKLYFSEYGLFHQWENYWPFLKYRLLNMEANELQKIYEVEEGIENRMLKAAVSSSSFGDFMEKIKTKRYTWTRLQRACVHILTNTHKEEMYLPQEKASYMRLLGMSLAGREYLNKMKSHFSLPLVSKLSSFKEKPIHLDIKAAKVYSCALSGEKQEKLLKMEFNQPPIYMK
ncbi:nucleotidyltransferase [Neobacillus terrae]|uniref:nucleotidyltransferase n=1 Tax=Neobacillus terrae TaxID=3034837 RepID=UPI00140D7D66|nr:nucleotidyltransferase [Neobacillus terrae]NHM29681.1 nucleotidyltransferase [Neobacillus terrae]